MTAKRTNHMEYMPDMQQISPEIRLAVTKDRAGYDPAAYTSKDVLRAINHDTRTPEDFAALLSPAAAGHLELMARAAKAETRRHFGNSVYLFTPLYISNYCENNCIYCGFHCGNNIHRMRLDAEGIEAEMKAIAGTGLEEILILVGESKKMSDLNYLGEACKIAKKYFKTIGLEVYPMNADGYAYLQSCGADCVTVFQETYDSDKYETLHLSGHKRVFPYRLESQERALLGGMRSVGFGALLGLADFRKDAFATGMHAYYIQRKYPQAEIAFSCPRLCPAPGEVNLGEHPVTDEELLQIILAYRLFMPFAGITVSTREKANFRDHIAQIAATKISAGVSTGIGTHTKMAAVAKEAAKKAAQTGTVPAHTVQAKVSEAADGTGDEQFEISDPRTVDEIYQALLDGGMQPIMNDYLYLEKEPERA